MKTKTAKTENSSNKSGKKDTRERWMPIPLTKRQEKILPPSIINAKR